MPFSRPFKFLGLPILSQRPCWGIPILSWSLFCVAFSCSLKRLINRKASLPVSVCCGTVRTYRSAVKKLTIATMRWVMNEWWEEGGGMEKSSCTGRAHHNTHHDTCQNSFSKNHRKRLPPPQVVYTYPPPD